MDNLLKKKKQLKAKKPNFIRTDSNKKIFKNKWRKPRGLHNKRRLKKKGHQKNPSTGYGSPIKVRYLHKSGLQLIKINNLKELPRITNENQAVVLGSTLSMKSKIKILEECQKNKINVFNIKSIQKYIDDSKLKLEERKKLKKKREEKKKKTKAEAEKKAEESKKESEEDKQAKIKEKVMEAKQEVKETPEQESAKQDQTRSKIGHAASSVPGTRQ